MELKLNQPAEWRFYEEVIRPATKKDSVEGEVTKELLLKTSIGKTVDDLIKEINNTLSDSMYGLHCFIHRWQHIQLKNLQENRLSP